MSANGRMMAGAASSPLPRSAAAKLPLLAFLVALVAAPWVLPEFHITLLNYIGLYALVALGLVLLTGVGGLTSFGQAAFVGLGAYTTAWLSTTQGASPWLGLVVGLVLTAAVAILLGLLTLRLSGHYLPLGTIAWGISLYYLFGNLELLGKHTGISGIPPIEVAGLELKDRRHFHYLIWAVLLGAMLLTSNLLDSREGRAIRALKSGSLMAEAMGVDTGRSKVIIFTIAALFACLSGWLYAHLQRFVSPTPFGLHIGIEYLFMAVVGGAGYVWGALAGAALITLLKQWLQDWLPDVFGPTGNFETIVFGIAMVLVLQYARDGLWPLVRRLVPAARRAPSALALAQGTPPAASARAMPTTHTAQPAARQVQRPPASMAAADAATPIAPLPRRTLPTVGQVLLEVHDLVKRFGGLVANDRISLSVHAGEILALIGPNGAGKSTLFNCLSGVLQASDGRVVFRGDDVTRRDARHIARAGMARTFQHVRMLPSMSVLENVALGAHARGRHGVLAAMLHRERAEERQLLAEAARQIERVGLAAQMHEPAGSLALGQQRTLEIARALCMDPCLLLLDEPAAGLRHKEKEALAGLLDKLRGEGIGIVLVEHDMEFVMGLADRVVVMEFGEKIAEGTPEAVQDDPRVREAYLGAAL